MRVCLFTDTIGDLNGVSRFIQDMARQSLQCGDELHVLTATRKRQPELPNIHNFQPSFYMPMPFYPELDLAFPPARAMKERIKALAPDVIHLSTPGPIGMLGYKIAKTLDLPILGTYHTDFPAYVRDNTGVEAFKRGADWVRRIPGSLPMIYGFLLSGSIF